MIYQVTTDFPGFLPIDLNSGVNIIIAKRKNNTTNGVGKTLLLACIDYVLGANYSNSKLIKYPELKNYTITLTMDFEREKVRASRKLDKETAALIKIEYMESSIVEEIDLVEWKKRLLHDKFNYDGELTTISWRSLLNFFTKEESVDSFEQGLKGFPGDNLQKTSLFQSYLLNISFKAFEENFLSASLVSEGRKLTQYVNKLKSVLEGNSELVLEDINDFQNFQVKINKDINNAKSLMVSNQKKVDYFSIEIQRLQQSLDYINNVVVNNEVDDLLSILNGEMKEYLKKSFEESKLFYKKLITENKEVITSELVKAMNLKSKYERQVNLHKKNLKKLLDLKEDRTKNLSMVNTNSLVINELLAKPSNEVAKEVNWKVKERSDHNREKILKELEDKKEDIEKYRLFLSKHVNEIYESNKRVNFDIKYDTALRVHFTYEDDSGTGKGNMKLLIYYYFILYINRRFFSRNMDMLILDTDFTDGIDSNNLMRFFTSVNNELIDANCQIICTLRDDRGVSIQENAQEGWVKRILFDGNGGYLFKEGLQKEEGTK